MEIVVVNKIELKLAGDDLKLVIEPSEVDGKLVTLSLVMTGQATVAQELDSRQADGLIAQLTSLVRAKQALNRMQA